MPRDIPVGNGSMLVTYDHHYQVRDIYFPHVGQENHAGGGPCRFGVYTDLPGKHAHDRRNHRICWTYDGWTISRMKYLRDTLTTDVHLHHDDMLLDMTCTEAVDFHRNIMVRRIVLKNLHTEPRNVRLYHHNDFHMFGTKIGDTAYYDPKLRMIVHYREKRYIMAGFIADGDMRIDEYATGNSGYGGAEGTWRDAEDGQLGGNAIAQGAIDSTMGLHVSLQAAGHVGAEQTAYLVIGCGHRHEDLVELHRFIHRDGPQAVIDRTSAYWRLWCWANNLDYADLPEPVVDLFRRSLLVLRTQIDNSGAIIAANDSDIMQFSRDTYSYMWPRDGALVAYGLDLAGYGDITRRFFYLCSQILTEGGYFLHKYNPDGSPASSWHPWVVAGRSQLPIQEDETALVLWALWQHYYRYRDIEFVRPLWMRLIQPAAEFMVRFRDPQTHLPLPSYDLWEERWGVHAFTVASVYGGLAAARNFAVCFGDKARAERYGNAAHEIRQAFCKLFWSDEHGRFLRRIEPRNTKRIGQIIEQAAAGRSTSQINGFGTEDPADYYRDPVIDSSLFGIHKFHLLEAGDHRVVQTMKHVEDELKVRTTVGGFARYADDPYHRVSDDPKQVPGNPWFICTLWMADWKIASASNLKQLHEAITILEWVLHHANPSGTLAEQVHPHTNAPLSVSPLTWSHGTLIGVVMDYLERFHELTTDGKSTHLHGRQIGRTRVSNELLIDKYQAVPIDTTHDDTM
ncbi:MAG: glycoside hydrolase family 15 protein [Phycisphaerales bacterium]